jgi:hypothetical protein
MLQQICRETGSESVNWTGISGLDWTGSKKAPVAGYCKHGNERPGSSNVKNFLARWGTVNSSKSTLFERNSACVRAYVMVSHECSCNTLSEHSCF